MGAKIRRYFHLMALYAKMDFRWLTQDAFGCLLTVFSDVFSNIAGISGLLLLALRFGGVGSMSSREVLLMLGYSSMITGLNVMFFGGNNTGSISRRIGRGQLEHMLIQPMPLFLQLMTEGFIPVSGNGVFLCGLLIFCKAFSMLELTLTFPMLLLLAGLLICSLAISVGISYLCGVFAFYYPVGCEEISSAAADTIGTLCNYPLSGQPFPLQFTLCTLLPSGCIAWLPVLALLGKSPENIPAFILPVLAVLICSGATLLFRKGMHHYVTEGIHRYRDMGHRR